MKKLLLILSAVVLGVSAPMVQQAEAIDFSISVGDRPYYHGNYYWHQGYRWYWVPGHYSRHRARWIPGHYVRRGDYNRAYARRHYQHHRVWVNDNNWR